MTNFQTGLRRQFTVKSVVFGIAALLALGWVGGWLLDLQEESMITASLAIVGVCLMSAVVRIAFGKRDEPKGVAAPQFRPTPESTPDRRTLRPYTEGAVADEASAQLNGKRWSLDVFAAIDGQRFAAVCETWFAWAGFDTRSEAHRTDEGVDIWLHAARMPGPVAIVRCRHWLNKPVGLLEMKEFLGLVSTCQSAHGTYTTTSTYTPEALQFARENGIDAVDGRGLLRRIQTRTRQRQQALLAVAYNGQSS